MSVSFSLMFSTTLRLQIKSGYNKSALINGEHALNKPAENVSLWRKKKNSDMWDRVPWEKSFFIRRLISHFWMSRDSIIMDCKQGNHMARDFDNLYHFFMASRCMCLENQLWVAEGSDRKTIKKSLLVPRGSCHARAAIKKNKQQVTSIQIRHMCNRFEICLFC